MSLPEHLLSALELDVERIRDRANFFAAYATIEEPSYNVHDLIRLMRNGPILEGNGSIINLMESDSPATSAIIRRLEDLGPPTPREQWIQIAEKADAWRESAIAELLNDTEAGRTSLLNAASGYQRLGLPFGTFLTVAINGSLEEAPHALDRLTSLLDSSSEDEQAEDDTLIGWRNAAKAPAQQISLLLTAVSNPFLTKVRYGFLSETLTTASQATSTAAIGTSGQPMAWWWEAGRSLVAVAEGNHEARVNLLAILTDLAQAHGQQLRLAQLDRYHWPKAMARIDLIDLDLAGLTAISARVLRHAQLTPWKIAEDFASLNPLAQVSLVIGSQLAEDEGTAPQNGSNIPEPDNPIKPRPAFPAGGAIPLTYNF